MDRRTISTLLVIIMSFTQKVTTQNTIFTCGVIHGNSVEYDVMDFAVNMTSNYNNVSIILRTFNVSDNINLLNKALELYQQNVVALIEGNHTKTSGCSLSAVTGIPLIRLHGDSWQVSQCEKAVQMSAGYRDYANASLEILNTFQWEKIALVFDESRLQEAWYFHILTQSSKRIVNLVQIPEHGKGTISIMQQIKEHDPEAILLFTNKENIELLLQQKPCNSKLNPTWILQGQVPMNLNCHPDNVVLAMKLPYIENSATEGLERIVGINYNDTNKEQIALAYDAIQVIYQALNRKSCPSVNESLITSEDRDEALACMKKVNLYGITGPIRFNKDGQRKEVDLEILNLQNSSFKKIAAWNSTQGVVLFKQISRNVEMLPSTKSLVGRKLRVVVVQTAPFLSRHKHKDGTVRYEGYCMDLLNELARILKFTYEIYLIPDGKYGALRKNGTWNGMIGELVNERADLVVADLTITESRENAVDFTVPYMYYTEDILLKKASSKNAGIDLLQFMNPFHYNVWYATLASLVVISVAVYVINYFSPYGCKDENGRGTSEDFSFFNSLWFALACLLQQGGDNTPRSLSGRILVGCYWFCILISISTYTANLAAFFTVKNAEQPINNLEDIVKSTYKVGVLESSSTYETFKTSQYKTHRKIWQRMHSASTFARNTSQAIQWVREREQYLFIIDGPVVKHAANQPPCDLTTVPGLSTAKGLAFALQANDPHTNDFTLAILRLHENYFLDDLKRKWWENANGCPQEQETTLSRMRIDLSSMLGVYVVLGVGIVLAFLTLIAEIFWKRKAEQLWKNRTRRSKIAAVQVQLEAKAT